MVIKHNLFVNNVLAKYKKTYQKLVMRLRFEPQPSSELYSYGGRGDIVEAKVKN